MAFLNVCHRFQLSNLFCSPSSLSSLWKRSIQLLEFQYLKKRLKHILVNLILVLSQLEHKQHGENKSVNLKCCFNGQGQGTARNSKECQRKAKQKPNNCQRYVFHIFTEMLIVFCCFEALNIKILKFVTSLNVLRLDFIHLSVFGVFSDKKFLCIEAVFTFLTFPKECQRNAKGTPK